MLQKLFASDSPNDRTFPLENILSTLSKNCSIILEAQKLEEINYLANQWILNTSSKSINNHNLFIGFNFFLFSPKLSIPANIVPLLIPFFPIKTFTSEETKLLGLWKKTNFSRYFVPIDHQGNFFYYSDTSEFFSFCTDDKAFYQLLLVQWQSFIARINLNPSLTVEKKVTKVNKQNLLLSLKGQCWQKLLALPQGTEEKYQQTLEKELALIEEFDYLDYFLAFSNVVKYLQEKEIIIGPGRGSAVSSLVAYLLGITKVDPLQHKLFLERFLNEKRKVMPDIDLDVENQKIVFDYLPQKYPKNQVARIIVRKKIGWKSAFQEAAKVSKVDEINFKKMSALIWKSADFISPKLQLWKLRYPLFFTLVEKIHNLYYDTVLHPAGIIIAEKSLVGMIPLCSKENYLVTLWEEEKLNHLGLKKYDFLSLKETLGVIQEARKILPRKLPDYNQINLQDEKTWKLFHNLLLTDIFQLDTLSARNLFSKFNPQNFSELVLFLALNRPGTRRKAEEIIQEKITPTLKFFAPALKEILTETYGFIIFEEQMSQILALVYNCSFAEAEVKRRELINQPLTKEFLAQAGQKLSSSESRIIYRQIVSAVGYTFNKAHAVAYSYLTYYIAYLKANYFSELITYFLNNKKDKTLAYLREAFFYDFQLEKPDINHSQLNWIRKEKILMMGFNSLKDYQVDFFTNLLEERRKGEYQNWEDFINRTIKWWDKVDLTTLEKWIKTGLFRSLQVDDNLLLIHSQNILGYLHLKQKLPQANNRDLPFLSFPLLDNARGSFPSKQLINEWEQENLGLCISYFARWKELAQKKDYSLSSLLAIIVNQTKHPNQPFLITIYAIIEKIEQKSNDAYTLYLEDVRSSFKLNITNQLYQENNNQLIPYNELLFVLKVEVKDGQFTTLLCEKIINI